MAATAPAAPPPHWARGFSWSVRRHTAWLRCRRRFYYDVVAPALPRGPVPYHQLEALRGLASVRAVQGRAVHAAVAAGIAAARAGGSPEAPAGAALDEALRPYARRPAETLAEVRNGQPFDPAGLEQARREGRAMTGRFFGQVWPRYAGREVLLVEDFGGFTAEGTRVRLRMDLVTRGPEGVMVTDWKTGRPRPDEAEGLQLGTYLLWATLAQGEPPERVRAELVHLADGTSRATARSETQLQRAARDIAASAAAMTAVRGIDDAPAAPGPHCTACPFATICPEGRAALPGP